MIYDFGFMIFGEPKSIRVLFMIVKGAILFPRMYLKSLEIHGFKSFAAKTELNFLPPRNHRQSITAIVGPNGSGKSNIVDAIRWALGEQSMKMLRGKKSEDVIFVGSENKSKLGLAAVTLTIDNSDQRAPVPYHELVITRRLYRSGESEYLLNHEPTRLFDIELLLARAGSSLDSYSIIGQGMIDRIILQTPVERLTFFDEASGIKELQLKRHQAALKLARSTEHMREAELVLSEVTPRLKSLSRQVKKLEERDRLAEELRTLQEQYYMSLWTDYERERQEVAREQGRVAANRNEVEGKLRSAQEELSVLANPERSGVRAAEAAYHRAAKERTARLRERAIAAAVASAGLAASGQTDLAARADAVSALRSRQMDIDRDLTAAEANANALGESRERAEKRWHECREEINRVRTHISAIEDEWRARPGDDGEVSPGRGVESLLAAREKFPGLIGPVYQLGRVAPEYQLALSVAAGGHLSSLVVSDDRVAERCIQKLRDERLGVATFLPQNRLTPRALSADIEGVLRSAGVRGLASDFIEYGSDVATAFSYLFGQTVVVESLAAALRLTSAGLGASGSGQARTLHAGTARMVTLDGDLIERGGVMKGGYRKVGGLAFSDRSRLHGSVHGKQAGQELIAQKQKFRQLEEGLEEHRRTREKALVAAEVAGHALAQVRRQKEEIISELRALAPAAADGANESHPRGAEADLRRLDNELLTLADREAAAEAELIVAQKEETKRRERAFTLQDMTRQLQRSLDSATSRVNECDVALAKIQTRQEDMAAELARELNTTPDTLARRGVSPLSATDAPQVEAEIQKRKYQMTLIGGIEPDVASEYAETKSRHEWLTSQLTDLTAAVHDLTALIAELDRMMRQKRRESFEQIRKYFQKYFTELFGGGVAEVAEVYEDEDELIEEGVILPSDSNSQDEKSKVKSQKPVPSRVEGTKVLIGLDVTARPPGKKITHLSALSGGERTLSAIALICAVLRVNPSPFVILDEVEAALDETNTLRFTQILRDLSAVSQFILITHNRATMHAADALYGVTLGPDGASRLMSVRLESVGATA